MELTYSSIYKSYGAVEALKKLDLTLRPGIYGLLGPNGAGKTTLMNITACLLKPSGGQVFLDGQEIASMGEKYRALLGYLPQKFGTYPAFTGREFLCYMGLLKGLKGKAVESEADKLLEMVGLSDSARRAMRGYSGGMKQRLFIASALINNPQIIIMDEPTVGLDPKERNVFLNLLSAVSGDKIVVLSTHIVSDVERVAQKIIIINKGMILKHDTTSALTNEIAGKVREISIKEDKLEQMCGKYMVTGVKREDGGFNIRVCGDDLPEGRPVQPSVEDVYYYTIGERIDFNAYNL